VPVDTPIRFRITSPDVLHGFQVVGTNANLVIVPGYVSEMITTFPEPGEYLIVCNEYCGTAHHSMYGRLIVETP
jgi:cytochrome c oxidase subunit 2